MGRENYKKLAILLCLFFASCVKDKPATRPNTLPSDSHGVYVICEGQYTAGDASLYLYHPLHDSVFGDMFFGANNTHLGDVLQSMVRIGDNFFLAVNNSNKVTVATAAGMKLVANIAVPYPRYILPVSADRAYVSSLYRNKVYVINTKSFVVTDSIQCPYYNTERMYLHYNSAYLCPWDTACGNIYAVDINTNKITQAIKVGGRAPHDILMDKEQMLWVLSGNQPKGKPAAWTRIDPSTGAILSTLKFPADAEPIKPVLNQAKDSIYFIGVNYTGATANNGIYRIGIHDAALPSASFIQAVTYQYFWALGIDPVTGDIYVGDPKGFNQKGSVSVYKPNGTKTNSFSVGVGPGQFCFDN